LIDAKFTSCCIRERRMLSYWAWDSCPFFLLLSTENRMAKQLNPPDLSLPDFSVLSNPMAWADFSMRALEMTLSSSQDIGERMERLTRAGASEEATEAVTAVLSPLSPAAPSRSPAAAASRVALASDLQRSTFDLMAQGWVQWMSMLGSLASLAAGLAFGPGGSRRNLPLNPLALLPGAGALDVLSPFGSSSRAQVGQQRETRAERTSAEHAHASAEPKRRRTTSRAKSKPRRSRRA
jgi:hypothetical protein